MISFIGVVGHNHEDFIHDHELTIDDLHNTNIEVCLICNFLKNTKFSFFVKNQLVIEYSFQQEYNSLELFNSNKPPQIQKLGRSPPTALV
jgi:hypothetical protein